MKGWCKMEVASIIGIDLVGPGGLILVGAFAVLCVLKMCDVTYDIKHFIPRFSGKSIKELFPNLHVKPQFAWENIIPGHCLYCKRPMSMHERYPTGYNTPHCMCLSCYNQLVAGRINENCIMSGFELPDGYIHNQQTQPREVQWNILPGMGHWEYYLLAANKALDEDVSYIREDQGAYGPQYGHQSEPVHVHPVRSEPIPVQPIYDDSDVQDADWEEMIRETMRLAGIEPRQIEHPRVKMIEHNPQETLDDWGLLPELDEDLIPAEPKKRKWWGKW
jgi:hypothetical protein